MVNVKGSYLLLWNNILKVANSNIKRVCEEVKCKLEVWALPPLMHLFAI